jgi:hypothetical protein
MGHLAGCSCRTEAFDSRSEIGERLLGLLDKATARGISNDRVWLQGDIQSPEIDFRFTPESGRN